MTIRRSYPVAARLTPAVFVLDALPEFGLSLPEVVPLHKIRLADGAIVMGTGIVSVALSLHDLTAPSRILLAIAASVWLGLLVACGRRWVADRSSLAAEGRSPAGLAIVAGTAVLGTAVLSLGWTAVAMALLAWATLGWAVQLPLVLRRLPSGAGGEVFLPTVATQGLATLIAELGARLDAPSLVAVAFGLTALGIAAYPISLARFSVSSLRCGTGAQWVSGGSVAISCLAVAEIALALRGLHAPGSTLTAARVVAIVLWALAMLWLAVLVMAELRWPRLRYRSGRWSTVFPVGMYAVCSFKLSAAGGGHAIGEFAKVWLWVAVACWLAVAAGLIGRLVVAKRSAAFR